MRVANILPGVLPSVVLTMVGQVPNADGEATYRLPLVVAPRYVPGDPLPGGQVGDGTVPDTDAVPDASRITPPVLLPGFPNPVRLSIAVDVDPAGLPLAGVRSSLHGVTAADHPGGAAGGLSLAVRPGARVNRDFLLRLGYGEAATATALAIAADAEAGSGDAGVGTFQLTVLPPVQAAAPRPRDVVLVLDRSGSMGGWKMVAARRAAARIVDTLTEADRFAVLTFDDRIDRPAGLAEGLVPGTDRNRYRAVEHLARVDARGGTELLPPLQQAAGLLSDPGLPSDSGRDRVLVLVTDGQVGNEDQLLARLTPALREVRVHAVGIDRAVNAGFLGRLAALGGGRCELVESEDRLDEATDRIHQRIGAPLVTGVRLAGDGLESVAGSVSPDRLPAIFPGVPLVVRGRWRGSPGGAVVLTGTTAAGEPWRQRVAATPVADGTLTPVWARAHLQDLEDAYAAGAGDPSAMERQIVATSLRYGVLCRFTAFVAIDARVVNEGGGQHRVVQPVELPEGWELPAAPVSVVPMAMHLPMPGLTAMDADLGGDPDSGSPPPPAPPAAQARVTPFAAAGAMWARAAGGRRRPGAGTDALTAARLQATDEARRLRSTGTGGSQPQRWAMLADLGSRLEALLRDLTGLADEAELIPLRSLVIGLAACDGPNPPRGADLDALWQRALAVLDAFAGSRPVPAAGGHPGSPTATSLDATLTGHPGLSPGGRVRGAFWKRDERG